MKTVRFRKHRGSLVESLDTAVLVSSKEDIAMVCTDETIDINPDLIEIAPCMGYDYRVGWYTHVVIYPDYGVLGFTDGNITELSVMNLEEENARMNIAQGAEQMSCKYCESKELVYLEKSEYVDLWMHGTELGASGESEAIKNINFCPMCGRKLEDV